MKKYWVSCEKFTVQVDTDDNDIIVTAAPIVRGFTKQPIMNLFRWICKRWPESFEFEILDPDRKVSRKT